jgi:hypothetical protein
MAINVNPEINEAMKDMFVTPAKQKVKKLRNKLSRTKEEKTPPAPITYVNDPNHRTAINPGLTEIAKEVFRPAVRKAQKYRKKLSRKSNKNADTQNTDAQTPVFQPMKAISKRTMAANSISFQMFAWTVSIPLRRSH